MNTESVTRFRSALGRFISGADRTRSAADEICKIIAEDFYDDDRFQDLLEATDLYSPEGTSGYFGEGDLVSRCKVALGRSAKQSGRGRAHNKETNGAGAECAGPSSK